MLARFLIPVVFIVTFGLGSEPLAAQTPQGRHIDWTVGALPSVQLIFEGLHGGQGNTVWAWSDTYQEWEEMGEWSQEGDDISVGGTEFLKLGDEESDDGSSKNPGGSWEDHPN